MILIFFYLCGVRISVDEMFGSNSIILAPVAMVLGQLIIVTQRSARKSRTFTIEVSLPAVTSVTQFQRLLGIIPAQTAAVQTRVQTYFVRADINLFRHGQTQWMAIKDKNKLGHNKKCCCNNKNFLPVIDDGQARGGSVWPCRNEVL